MASRSERHPVWHPLCAAALTLALALAFPALASAGDEDPPAEEPTAAQAESTRTVTVGKATLKWHLAPAPSVKRAALVEAFKKASAAHLTGGEPYVSPETEPVEMANGEHMHRLPAELMHAMFVGPTGRNYCSDSTVVQKATAVSNADGEGR